ncbi:nucleotidyltransferase family protein [bacterium]|nr:nucleotidyltransferase family protein [bacterium]
MPKNLKAVILAGGKGTRLYPITYEIPKPLLPVKRKPIINYLVELFCQYNISDIAILISKDFEEEFNWWKKRFFPRKKILLIEESKPLGTFGGLYYLRDWLRSNDFFLTNGDELKMVDLKEMACFHRKAPGIATIALVKVKNPQDYGVVVTKSKLVSKFLEKPKNPPSKYISSGLYLLSQEIFDYHPGPKFSMIEKDVFPKLAKERKLAGFKFQGKWTDCGTWQRYSEAIKKWQ